MLSVQKINIWPIPYFFSRNFVEMEQALGTSQVPKFLYFKNGNANNEANTIGSALDSSSEELPVEVQEKLAIILCFLKKLVR